MPLQKLTRTGGSFQITVPVKIAREWIRDDVVAVDVEWIPPDLRVTPVTLRQLRTMRGLAGRKEDRSGDHTPGTSSPE